MLKDIKYASRNQVFIGVRADLRQIASHSWGHANMSSLNETELVKQVHYLEMAFRNILGFFPTYFRPPYDDCRSATCQSVLKRMGYHISKFERCSGLDWVTDVTL
jgi:peptidoglycan/xylan/chitin deacetylase (PgdA/CDA1 family)